MRGEDELAITSSTLAPAIAKMGGCLQDRAQDKPDVRSPVCTPPQPSRKKRPEAGACI